MNILHATTDPTLLVRLKQMLGSSVRADIAVGYFFINGFDTVADEVAKQENVRILVGRTDRHVLEEVAAGIQQADALREKLDAEKVVRRRDQEQIAGESVDLVGRGVSQLAQTASNEEAVRKLRDLISAGKVEVRSYAKSTLHAKAYLCWYEEGHAEPGAAVVGSSNFTLAGFTGNTELNVRVTGDAEMAELKRWYEELWKDSRDITDELLAELNRSWAVAQTPPYHVYLKALFELYRDSVVDTEELLAPARRAELATFQMDAVRQALRIIGEHGGCYIADVVGLGKSYVGSEILRQLRQQYPNDGPPLIICPRNLIPQWERYSEMFGLGAEVISQSMIAPPPGLEYDEDTGEYLLAEEPERGINLSEKFSRRGAVLIDESHNFRNDSGRYRGLKAFLDQSEHKTVLLSATPQNIAPRDMYRQITLFLDEREHGIPVEPVALQDFFSAAEDWYGYRKELEAYKAEFKAWEERGGKGALPMSKPTQPKAPRADIEDLLKPIVIRRRRRDIRELYADAEVAGKPLKFLAPDLKNIPYRLDHVYEQAGEFNELLGQLNKHTAARYRVTDFITTEAMQARPDRYTDLFRARNRIAALMKSLLIKRLESSVPAFRSTLESLVRSNRNFRESLERGFVPVGKTATNYLAGESFDPDQLLEALEREEKVRINRGDTKRSRLMHPASDFRVDDWLKELDQDFGILTDLLKRLEPIKPEDDDKLQELKKFLELPEVKTGKVLIFSEAETTVDYLYAQLNPGGGDETIARLSGQTRSSIENVVRRFSPGSQLKPGERLSGKEVRVLIATDVVSEGQNLQDCNRVINYDLHWNPVRMIQRFGRVDRIGQDQRPALHNFWPDTAVDAEIELTDRLVNRIQMFHDLIGLDSRLLSADEQLNLNAMYRIYAEQRMPDDEGDDPLATHQRGITLLQKTQREAPDLWDLVLNLPDGIRSALKIAGPGSGESDTSEDEAVFVQAALKIKGAQLPFQSPSTADVPDDEPREDDTVVLLETRGVNAAYAVGETHVARQIPPGSLVGAVECCVDTPAASLPADTNERVMAAYDQFKEDVRLRLGRMRRPGTDTRLRRWLSRSLNVAREQTADDDQDERRRIDELRRIFLDYLPGTVITVLQDVRSAGLSGSLLVERLEALRRRFNLTLPDEDEDTQPTEPAVIRIICSDALDS